MSIFRLLTILQALSLDVDKIFVTYMACGTDGDKALVEAITHSFPYALQLRCFLHFRRNIQEKLREMGLPSLVSEEFVHDIFGKRTGNTFQEGLVDSSSADEVQERLSLLEPIWNARESPHAPASGPQFYAWFCQYQADIVKHHMRKDLREAAGLGCPPANFTTNGSESINSSIKRHVKYKESEWPKFNEAIKQIVSSQHDEVIRALSGCGQYRLCSAFSHYMTSTQEWMKMRPDQRQTIVNNFQKANLPERSTISVMSTNAQCSSTSCSLETTTCGLSISAEDSGISTIPLVTLEGMWTKAKELLSHKNAITPAPGNNKKAHMVLSYSQVAPHLIQNKTDGQYICDDSCLQWKSSQICSHTLAAAQHNSDLSAFLQWYTQNADNPNISALAMIGLS